VTNALILLVSRTTESEVAWVSAVFMAANEREAAYTSIEHFFTVLIDDWFDSTQNVVIIQALGVTDSDVANSRKFFIFSFDSGLALATKIRDQTVLALASFRIGWERLEGLQKVLISVIEELYWNNSTPASWLAVGTVCEVGHIAD